MSWHTRTHSAAAACGLVLHFGLHYLLLLVTCHDWGSHVHRFCSTVSRQTTAWFSYWWDSMDVPLDSPSDPLLREIVAKWQVDRFTPSMCSALNAIPGCTWTLLIQFHYHPDSFIILLWRLQQLNSLKVLLDSRQIWTMCWLPCKWLERISEYYRRG